MRKALAEFLKDLAKDFVTLLTGLVSLALWAVMALWRDAPVAAHWGFWLGGAAAMACMSFRVWKRQYDSRLTLQERLRPRLEISSATQSSPGHLRIVVRNLSHRTIRFGVNVVEVKPSPHCPLPAPLLLNKTEPHEQRDIPGGGSYPVEVIADVSADGGRVRWMELMVREPLSQMRINPGRYEITICAYPISPDEGMSVSRRFHIIPQSGGGHILSDAGPCEATPVTHASTK